MTLPILKTKIDQDSSFANYLWRASLLLDKPYLKRKILEKIPKEILKKINDVIQKPVKFTLKKHPLSDLKERFFQQKTIIKKIEKIFKKDWKFFYQDIKETKKILEEIIKNYGKNILKEVQYSTKCLWPYKKIIILSDLLSEGGGMAGNTVFIGFGKRTRESYLKLLIHELIHLNTSEKRRKLKISRKTDEIATVVLTNKIITQLNKKLKLNIFQQNFPSYNQKILKPYFKKFLEFGNTSSSYLSLVKKIDNYLKMKKIFHLIY